MKIILTVHQFFPEWQSGTEVLTRDTAKTLIARGHDVEIWTGQHEPHPQGISHDFFEYQGIPVHRYYGNLNEKAAGSDCTRVEYENQHFTKLFADHLQKRRPDVVHAYHLFRLSCSALKFAQDAGVCTVYTPTDFWSICPAIQLLKPDDQLCLGPTHNSLNCVEHLFGKKMPSFLKAWPSSLLQAGAQMLGLFCSRHQEKCKRFRSLLERIRYNRRIFSRIDAILIPSRFMEQMLIRNGIPKKRFFYQPFGVNIDHLHPLNKKTKTDRLRVGFIGTLAKHKAPHVLIRAVKELPLDAPIEVRIYGKPTDYPEYAKCLHVLADHDPRISFCDTFPNHEIGSVLSNMDVLVVPSVWYENTPLVVYSAQASKTPVIASDLGGLSGVISHEENGLLFPAGDHRTLAKTLFRLTQDPDLLSRLSQNAQAPKSMDQYVDELEKIYEKLLRTKEKK